MASLDTNAAQIKVANGKVMLNFAAFVMLAGAIISGTLVYAKITARLDSHEQFEADQARKDEQLIKWVKELSDGQRTYQESASRDRETMNVHLASIEGKIDSLRIRP